MSYIHDQMDYHRQLVSHDVSQKEKGEGYYYSVGWIDAVHPSTYGRDFLMQGASDEARQEYEEGFSAGRREIA